MTEVELIEEIATATEVSKVAVAKVLQCLKRTTTMTLESGEHVVLRGFGTFFVAKLKKKPLFGEPSGRGTWSKVKFQLSRRSPLGKVRRSNR